MLRSDSLTPALTPNQRILIGATFLVFGIAIYAYDALVQKEEDVELQDDLRERLAKAQAAAGGTSSEGLKVDDVGAVRAALAEAKAAGINLADEAVAAGSKLVHEVEEEAKAVGSKFADAAKDAAHHTRKTAEEEKAILAASVQAVNNAAKDEIFPPSKVVKERVVEAAAEAVAEARHLGRKVGANFDDPVRSAEVVLGEVPERTRWFGIRLRGANDK